MSVLDLARADIRAMEPYSSARMEASGGSVLLNANESAWPPAGHADGDLHRYPEPQPRALVAQLAALYEVRPDQLLVGRGSDEAIDLLVRTFCRAGEDAILVSPPTFGMYAVSARIQGAAVIELPLDPGFGLDPDALLAAVTPAVKLVFVCSPNNPTGTVVGLDVLDRLAHALQGRAVLVVDEAYAEFAACASATGLLARYDNVCVLRTLSKAWALAGARIGSLLARRDVVALLRKVMPPYPLPQPCVEAALAALSPQGQAFADEHVHEVLAERARVGRELTACPGVRAVLPSRANFLAVRFDDAGGVYAALLRDGIVVRDIRRYRGLDDALRITIGRSAENDRLLSSVRAVRGVVA
jgi:histidinol-phosphate aminotransferase